MTFYLVFIKSYRDQSISVEELKKTGKVFLEISEAAKYRNELEEMCNGWLETEILEL